MQHDQYDGDWSEAVLHLKQFLGRAKMCTIIIFVRNCLLERLQQHLAVSADDSAVCVILAFQVWIIDREDIAERRRHDAIYLYGSELQSAHILFLLSYMAEYRIAT